MSLYIPNGLFLTIGVILIIISIVIWCTKSLRVIAAHNEERVYNEEKLLKWTVLSFLISGILIVIGSALAMVYTFINSAIIFGIVICAMALSVGIGCTKYEI
ncbi:DUF3784 domain-containing protein [uncultured Clostridium sp.]|jgi:flagellar biosynthesis protein FlhB|uniref:DUF3784 domain-containing protein n=1 Tax=uncultured Clostridium sp. TaxID=59620 RepID=UPI00261E7F71|nr:DUF3784 domain-containing protein [uncultured Clostridium sp.]